MTRDAIRIGIIGGTGLGEALGAEQGELVEIDTPFGPPSAPLIQTRWHDVELVLLQRHGVGHRFNPSTVPYRANIFAMKTLGVTHLIASGATGSLVEHVQPGDLVLVDQIIDKTHKRPNTFYDDAAVHVEFAQPFCPVMRRWLLDAAKTKWQVDEPAGSGDWDDPSHGMATRRQAGQTRVHARGTYVCMEGPAFSTVAESRMHRAWGGTLIGMTAMPEARLAREAEIAYALIGLPTDYDCWRPPRQGKDGQDNHAHLLEEILANLKRAVAAGTDLIKLALQDLSPLQQPSPAHDALRLAIWSDKAAIPRDAVERLAVLWGRYFD